MLRAVVPPALAERLCRPQRVGLFGHRGVGKTTFLTMLYREAVSGRLPGLRLAAADARTADYLSDKILQLESGQPLPATLAETELRFQLYHDSTRIELLIKDYQGEHIALGRDEPIRDFLRDCDAVWLCLDAETASNPGDRLRRQQEVEQLLEDYLAVEPQRTMQRPIALMITKADLLGPDAADLDAWTAERFGMTRHALESHCPRNGLFAVSSLGRSGGTEHQLARSAGEGVASLTPENLDQPLTWLTAALQAQDAARLDQLWREAPRQLALLERCVACFAQRYPASPLTVSYQQRLAELRRSQRRRRGILGAAAAACLMLVLSAYDVLGHQQAMRFEAEQADDPAAVLQRWQSYRSWHPTRHLWGTASAQEEEERLRRLSEQVRVRQREEHLADLRHQAELNVDPEAVWFQFVQFRKTYPEVAIDGDLQKLQTMIKARRDERFHRRAQAALDELLAAERKATDLESLVVLANQFLRDFGESSLASKVRGQRDAYLQRLDARDIQAARDYSARSPMNFQTRRELYQRYLDRHPAGGAYTKEATDALKAIDSEWDRHDFRGIRDHFLAKPGQVNELVARCRAYLAVHPQGRFTAAARDLLRWSERVTTDGEYRVVLRWGSFDRGLAHWFGRGLDTSVELEVAGVRYGPSPIVAKNFDPEWDYEFPRRVRWKLGDPVRIRVTDHKWKDRVIVDHASEDGDPLAIRLISGEVWSGNNQLLFESDFTLPTLPRIE